MFSEIQDNSERVIELYFVVGRRKASEGGIIRSDIDSVQSDTITEDIIMT